MTAATWRHRSLESLALLLLACAAIACAGFHPWSEDGGLYVAGVEWRLDPTLFPHDRAFVTAHLGYSLFAPLVAALVRLTHLSVAAILLWLDLAGAWLELYAALQLARCLFQDEIAAWSGVAMLAAAWTLPVAGTSLLLNDPYVTARTLSTPLSLLAVALAVDPQYGKGRRWIKVATALLLAAAFHPLMAGYALGLVLALLIFMQAKPWRWATAAACTAIAGCSMLQAMAKPDASPTVAAAVSRFYWFLSRWRWFEWLGLLGPWLIFAAARRWPPRSATMTWRTTLAAAIGFGLLAVLIATLFAQEHLRAHLIARMQPLRAFLLLYALLAVLVGGLLASATAHWGRLRIPFLALLLGGIAIGLGCVQHAAFAPSRQIEWPDRLPANPWAQAFLWAHDHTPSDALFALDAHYVNADDEGALVFRAVAQRSMVPDYSKDGGEAAITPMLAMQWLAGAGATHNLDHQTDAERRRRLLPLGTGWLVLRSAAATSLPCPYRNTVVKVCRL